MRKIILIFVILMLTGCGPVAAPPDNTYTLTSVPKVKKERTRSITLLVPQPETSATYRTMQMAYSLKPYQISYYANNRWIDTPSGMLQRLMIQTLQNTHFFKAVVPPVFVGQFNYLLNTHLVKLQQNFTQHPSVVELVMRADLISVYNNHLIASKEFSATVPVMGNTPYSAVVAANKASSQVLKKISDFIVNTLTHRD
jgi:cholesterol transport system auxiliary component